MKRHLGSFFNDHKGARRLVLAWAVWLFTIVTLRVTEPTALAGVNAATASIIATLVGLLTIPIGFYFQHRKDDDRDT